MVVNKNDVWEKARKHASEGNVPEAEYWVEKACQIEKQTLMYTAYSKALGKETEDVRRLTGGLNKLYNKSLGSKVREVQDEEHLSLKENLSKIAQCREYLTNLENLTLELKQYSHFSGVDYREISNCLDKKEAESYVLAMNIALMSALDLSSNDRVNDTCRKLFMAKAYSEKSKIPLPPNYDFPITSAIERYSQLIERYDGNPDKKPELEKLIKCINTYQLKLSELQKVR